MAIQRLRLTNYRSYAHHSFDLHPVATIVVGANATGKTNLLEALYVLASTKSFRARDHELVRHGSDHFRIEADTPETKIGLGYQTTPTSTKRVDYNQVRRPLSRHVGNLPTVLFEPNDLMLLSGPPALRRRYLDGILSQSNPEYLAAINEYQRVLKQRNSLLERFDVAAVKNQIFAWDLNLTTNAAIIVSLRRELLDHLNGIVSTLYQDITGQPIELTLAYSPSVSNDTDYATAFMDALVANLTRDLAAGFTTIGPHREDFTISFNNSELSAVASRGEVRSVVLALKLAELESLTLGSATPLLLLDDVFSELDASRRQYLISRLKAYQSVITTTDADVVQSINLDHTIIETNDLGQYGTN